MSTIYFWLVPKTLIDLHGSLGLNKIYHGLVMGFSHISLSLSQVNKGVAKARLFWVHPQHKSLYELNHHLCDVDPHIAWSATTIKNQDKCLNLFHYCNPHLTWKFNGLLELETFLHVHKYATYDHKFTSLSRLIL